MANTILFIEREAPQRAILVTDVIECKVSGGSYNYDTKTYSGELRIKNIPFQMLETKGMVDKIRDSLEFPTATDAKETLNKVAAIIKEDGAQSVNKHVLPVLDGATKMTAATPTKAKDVKAEVIETKAKTEIKTTQAEPAQQPKAVQQPTIVTDKTILPAKDKRVLEKVQKGQNLTKKEKKRLEQLKRSENKITPDNLKQHVFGNTATNNKVPALPAASPKVEEAPPQQITPIAEQVKTAEKLTKEQWDKQRAKAQQTKEPVKEPVKELNKETDKEQLKINTQYRDNLGIIIVNLSKYENAYFIGHLYKNKDHETEAIVIFTPKIGSLYDLSLPMIFINEETAKFVHAALLKHPVHSLMLGNCIVRPLTELAETVRVGDAALIQNGLTYVNKLESDAYVAVAVE